MRILLITDSYPPEIRSASQLMKDLADGFKKNGHEVGVATSYPQYNLGEEKKSFPEISAEDGIQVLRIKTLPHHKVSFIIRGIAQLTMPYVFFYKIKKYFREKIDVVIIHSPPLPLSMAAHKVKKFYGAKYILNLHDIFPQNAIDLGVLSGWKYGPIIRLFERMEKNAYKNADLIVVPSEKHKIFLADKRGVKNDKISVVYHWIDVEPYRDFKKTGRFRKLYGLENKFIFLFGGVLGPSQGLDLIIRAAEKLKDNKEIIFLFIGDGGAKESLVKMAEEKGLENVIFKPFIPVRDYQELVKDSDVGIVCLTSRNTTPAVPAKILGYMVVSVPVVVFVQEESDAHLIVEEARCGYSAVSDNENETLAVIKRIYNERDKLGEYGRNGFNYLLKNMEKNVCVAKFENLIKNK